MKTNIYVKRSPARMSWWVMFEDKMIETRNTKREAEACAEELRRKYRV